MASVFSDTANVGGFSGGGFGGGIPFGVPVGGYAGGLGGDGLGLIALLALLGGRGFGRDGDSCHRGGDGDGNAATIAALSALVQNRNNDDDCCESLAVLSKLASIEGAIPAVGSQIQLALANLAAGLTAQNNTNTQTVTNQLGQIQLGQLVQSNAIQKAIADVDTNVDRTAATVINTVRDDGNATRALITANVIQDLRDDKVILANELAECRNERNRDRDRNGIEINMLQNQQQAQLQFQDQRNEFDKLRGLLLETVQLNRATNQAINIGAGTQTASPVNTQSNVRA